MQLILKSIANELIKLTGRPIAAPSANKSGRISPTRAEDVINEFQNELEIINSAGLNSDSNINLIKSDLLSLPKEF